MKAENSIGPNDARQIGARISWQSELRAEVVFLSALSRIAFVGIVLILCFAGPVGARELTLREVLQVYPDEITFVTKCGHWEEGQEARGMLRSGTRPWIASS